MNKTALNVANKKIQNMHSCGIGGGSFMMIYDPKESKTKLRILKIDQVPKFNWISNFSKQFIQN